MYHFTSFLPERVVKGTFVFVREFIIFSSARGLEGMGGTVQGGMPGPEKVITGEEPVGGQKADIIIYFLELGGEETKG